jgi:3-keto-L-gulonate-6-phosphate decarboxylase
MIDMLGVAEPMKVLRGLRRPPDCVILHKGRDEEKTRGKLIQYKHINKIKSKYDVVISAAGGIDLRESRSAIFNGADIVIVNIVQSGAGWTGIDTASDIGAVSRQFLDTIS